MCLYMVFRSISISVSHNQPEQNPPLILSSISDKKYNDIILVNHQRVIIDQFISQMEVNNLVELLTSRQSIFRKQYNGTFVCECTELLYDYSHVSNETTPHQMKLLKSLLKVSGDVSNYIDTFFNTSVQLQTCVTNVRRSAGYSHRLHFKNSNISEWTHGIHSDQCRLMWNKKDTIVCDDGDPHIRTDRHYTAVLYLNEIDGGNLAFVDLPQNSSIRRTYRSLEDIPPPSNVETMEFMKKLKENRRRGLGSDENNEILVPGNDEFYITREGIFTVVPPTAGKLAIFTSGAENIHGVTEVLGDARYVIYLWYNRVN